MKFFQGAALARFEPAVISVDWRVLLIAGTLSTLYFRQASAIGGKTDEKG